MGVGGVWVEELGVMKDALVVRNEVFLHTVRALGHFVGLHADLFHGGSPVEDKKIVLGGVGIGEDQFDRLVWRHLKSVQGEEKSFGDASDLHYLDVLLRIEIGFLRVSWRRSRLGPRALVEGLEELGEIGRAHV